MARTPTLKSDRQIAEDLREALRNRGGITNWSFDSMGRILGDTLTAELARTNAENRRAFESLQLSTATGADLDYLGLQWAGLQRKLATFAKVNSRHKNLYFYAMNQASGTSIRGTFGDINGGSNIVIPRGTQISSRKVTNSSNSIIYNLDTDITLLASDSIKFVNATAITMGAGMNCADGVLRYHDFGDYTNSGFNSLKCNNRFPVLNGADRESDTAYRFRVAEYIPAIVQNNQSKIRLIGLTIPGVEDIRILNGYFGIGSAAVVVFGIDHEATPALTAKFQELLNQNQGPGLAIVAISGVRVYFDFDLRILVTRQLSLEEENVLKTQCGNMLISELKSFEKTKVIPLGKIAAAVAATHPLIAGLIGRIDSPNSSRKAGFENVYIRKTFAGEIPGVERQRILTSRFSLKDEEITALGEVNMEIVVKA